MNKSFEREFVVLAVKRLRIGHAAEALKESIESFVNSYKFDNDFQGVVSDEDSSLVRLFKQLFVDNGEDEEIIPGKIYTKKNYVTKSNSKFIVLYSIDDVEQNFPNNDNDVPNGEYVNEMAFDGVDENDIDDSRVYPELLLDEKIDRGEDELQKEIKNIRSMRFQTLVT